MNGNYYLVAIFPDASLRLEIQGYMKWLTFAEG